MTDGSAEGRFGNSTTLDNQQTKLQTAASELDQLQALLNRQVNGLVGNGWTGRASGAFGEAWRRQSDTTGQLRDLANQHANSMSVLSGMLSAAKARFEAAQAKAQANQLMITPSLTVVALNPSDERSVAMIPAVQADVTAAWEMAQAARQTAEANDQAVLDGLVRIANVLTEIVSNWPGVGSTGRKLMIRKPPATVTQAFERIEQFLAQQKEKAWRIAENARNPRYAKEMEQLTALHGPKPPGAVAHHNFPVEYSGRLRALGIETENPATGTWVSARDHMNFTPELRKDWAAFWEAPRNAPVTKGEVYDFARSMGDKYGYKTPF